MDIEKILMKYDKEYLFYRLREIEDLELKEKLALVLLDKIEFPPVKGIKAPAEKKLIAAIIKHKLISEASHFLSNHLRDEDPEVRLLCLDALRTLFREMAVPEIASLLEDDVPELVAEALRTIAHYNRDKTYFEKALKFLDHPSMTIRMASVEAVFQFNFPKAKKFLFQRLQEEKEEEVKLTLLKGFALSEPVDDRLLGLAIEMATSLEEPLRVRSAVKILIHAIKNSVKEKYYPDFLKREKLPLRRAIVYQDMGASRMKGAFSLLEKGLSEEENEHVRGYICEGLGFLREKKAIPLLKSALNGVVVSQAALSALKRVVTDLEEIRDLLPRLKESHDLVKQGILFLLMEVRDIRKGLSEPEMGMLKHLLSSSNDNVRYLSWRVFERIDISKEFVLFLERAALEKSPFVQEKATKTITKTFKELYRKGVKIHFQEFCQKREVINLLVDLPLDIETKNKLRQDLSEWEESLSVEIKEKIFEDAKRKLSPEEAINFLKTGGKAEELDLRDPKYLEELGDFVVRTKDPDSIDLLLDIEKVLDPSLKEILRAKVKEFMKI